MRLLLTETQERSLRLQGSLPFLSLLEENNRRKLSNSRQARGLTLETTGRTNPVTKSYNRPTVASISLILCQLPTTINANTGDSVPMCKEGLRMFNRCLKQGYNYQQALVKTRVYLND